MSAVTLRPGKLTPTGPHEEAQWIGLTILGLHARASNDRDINLGLRLPPPADGVLHPRPHGRVGGRWHPVRGSCDRPHMVAEVAEDACESAREQTHPRDT